MAINTFSLLIIFPFVLFFKELSIARCNTDLMLMAATLFLCVYLNIIFFFYFKTTRKKRFLLSGFFENLNCNDVKFRTEFSRLHITLEFNPKIDLLLLFFKKGAFLSFGEQN